MTIMALAAQSVTWIKVDRPIFDLVGVVISSLGLAGICAAVALGLGTALGVGFIIRARRMPGHLGDRLSLHLLEVPPH